MDRCSAAGGIRRCRRGAAGAGYGGVLCVAAAPGGWYRALYGVVVMTSKKLTAIASTGAEKARIEWGRGTLDYGKALPPMNLVPRREYQPDKRLMEAYERAKKELRDVAESLYDK